jgi:hypothetical protein
MSDDDDRLNWFMEDDDWWFELVSIIRSFVTDPVPVSVGQLRALSNELTKLTDEATEGSPIDLRVLEKTLKTHDMERLPVSSLVALVELSSEQLARGGSQYQDMLDNVGIMRLASIMRPKTGSLQTSDVVGLVRLAAQRNRRNADVLDKLSIGDLTRALTKSSLRSVTIGDLRSSLEALVNSGLLVKEAS